VISQPKFGIAGLRNADVRQERFGADPTDAQQLRRRRMRAGKRQTEN
jgi:hypothetical protein